MNMEKNNAHRRKEERCEICGDILTKGLCSNCGWVQIIFPSIVPLEITEFNMQHKEVIKKLHKKCCDFEFSLKQMKENNETVLLKNKKLEGQQKVLEQQLEVKKEDANRYKNELSESFQKNEILKKQISMLESTAKVVEAQRKDLIEKLKKANDNLAKEINEHKETKLKLEQFEADNPTYPMPKHPQAQPQPCTGATQQQGQPVAKIIFSCGTQAIQKNVFDGNNNYVIPASMNSSVCGDAFRIESLNGKVFRLYDLCGLTCKVNGDKIRTAGMQLYDKDYFCVGHINVQIKLPKMNLRDLLK